MIILNTVTWFKMIKMKHGGKRPNSGPKVPMSQYGEKTAVVRVPTSIKADVIKYLEAFKINKATISRNNSEPRLIAALNPEPLARPIYSGKVSAGLSRFPSPAQDYEQEELDLNNYLIKNAPATFFYRVGKSYDSMIGVGIYPNALLIVNRSISPKSSHIVVAVVDGEEVVKRLYKWRDVIELRSENKEKNYPPIVFTEGQELVIEGVVTSNVNEF